MKVRASSLDTQSKVQIGVICALHLLTEEAHGFHPTYSLQMSGLNVLALHET
jgi:hypothetical protein